MSSALETLQRRPGIQTLVLAGSTGASQVMTAVITLLVVRSSSPDAFGQVSVTLGLGVVLVGLVDFGSNEYWVRQVARDRDAKAEMMSRQGTKILLASLLGVALVLIGIALRDVNPTLWALGLMTLTLQLEQTLQIVPRALARAHVVAASLFLDRVVALGVVLLPGVSGLGAVRLLLALCVGNMAGAVFLWLASRRELPQVRIRLGNPWRGSLHYGVFSVTASLQALDVPVLSAAGGERGGNFGAVNRWIAPMGLLISGFSLSAIPFVAESRDLRVGWRSIRRASLLLVGALITAVVVAVFADPITLLLLGPEYAQSGQALRWLALSMILVTFNQPVATLLQASGHDRAVSLCMPLGVGVQLLLIFLLAPTFGAAGAGLAAFGGQAVMALLLGAVLLVVLRRQPSGQIADASTI